MYRPPYFLMFVSGFFASSRLIRLRWLGVINKKEVTEQNGEFISFLILSFDSPKMVESVDYPYKLPTIYAFIQVQNYEENPKKCNL